MNSTNDRHNDRKSLDLLVERLFKDKEPTESPNKKRDALKCKQLSLEKFSSSHKNRNHAVVPRKSPRKRKIKTLPVKHIKSPESKILTGWLTKSPINSKRDNVPESKSDTKENKTNVKKSSKQLKSEQSKESYERYGMKIPSYDDIRKFQEKNKRYMELMDNIKPIRLKENKVSPVKHNKLEILQMDCKFLTQNELKMKFYDNVSYIREIFEGSRYCKRHEMFKHENMKNNYTEKDLRYCPSMGVFTVDQKQALISLIRQEFDDKDPFTLNQYYFKVLLPEICLKIFMDVHKMDKKDAVVYLEQLPVVD